jgi:hypothetical protein
VKFGTQSLKLTAKSPQDVVFNAFTNDVGGMQIGCGTKFPPVPAVITYIELLGELKAVEFVPKSFKIEN